METIPKQLPVDTSADSENQREIIVNKLLTYAIHYIDSQPTDSIKAIILEFYGVAEIASAKKCIMDVCKRLDCVPKLYPMSDVVGL